MLWGEGRNAENFFAHSSFSKAPGNTDSLPPDFTFSGMVSSRAGADWLSKCQRTVGHCSFFAGDCLLSGPVLKRTSKSRICLCINQSLWPPRGFPLSFAEILYKQLRVFLPVLLKFDLFCSQSIQTHLFRFLASHAQSQPPFSHPAQFSPHYPILSFLYRCPKLLTCVQALALIFLIFKPNLPLLPTTYQKKRDIRRPGKTEPKATTAQTCNYTVQKKWCPPQTDFQGI